MNNNNDNKYGRTMDFSRHQEIVQELRQQLIVMKQQIKTFEEEATTTTALHHTHEQLLDAYSDMHNTNLSLQHDKETLMLQVRMLQDINVNTQYQLVTLQSKMSITCQHKFQCGCATIAKSLQIAIIAITHIPFVITAIEATNCAMIKPASNIMNAGLTTATVKASTAISVQQRNQINKCT